MWDKTEVLLYGSWIAYAIRKGNIIMVCDESYQFNLDDIRGKEASGIHCTDTDRYTLVPLTTTTQ